MENVQRSTGKFQRSSEKNINLNVETSLLNVERFTSKGVNPHRGFTLLEVLVSITIIAFLCGLIVGFARLANHTARRQQARAELANWQEALERWHARFGEYPDPGVFTSNRYNVETKSYPVLDLYEYYEDLPFDDNDPDKYRYFFEQTGSSTNAAAAHSLLVLSLQDPWGMDYHFQYVSEDEYELWSSGPDSQSGTPDDIRLKP